MKKRVLHCIPSMGGGGAERQLVYLCKGLSTRGWRVHVAILREGPNIQALRNSGSIIHLVSSCGNHDPLNFARVLHLVRSIRPSCVQTWLPMMDIIGGVAAHVARVPHIISERTSGTAHEGNWKSWLRRQMGERARAVVSNSEDGDAYWQRELQNPAVERFIIPNSLPLRDIDAALPNSNALPGVVIDRRIILYVGRLDVPKNLECLVAAMLEAVRLSDAVAVLVGTGPAHASIRELIRNAACEDRIFLLGYQSDVWSWMKRAAVFVSVSLFEGMPNAVMESMACACPLVVSNIRAHRTILEESCAIFVDPMSPSDICAGILRCLENGDTSRAMAQRARERAAHWSIERMAELYESLYLRIAAS